MNYQWDQLLAPEERLLKEFTISSRYLLITVSLIAVIGIIISLQSLLAGIFIFLLDIIHLWYLQTAKHYAFTDKRVILVESFITKNITSIYYNQLTDTQVDQNVLERLGGWGTIALNTAGTHSPETRLSLIDNPQEVKKNLDQLTQTAQHN